MEGSLNWMADPEGPLGLAFAGGGAPLTWDDNTYDPKYGARFSLGYAITPGSRIDLSASWSGSFSASSRRTGQFGFSPGVGVSPVASATFKSNAELYGAGLTWRSDLSRSDASAWTAGLGLRALYFRETGRVDDWAGLSPTSSLKARARDTFFGGELGVGWEGRIGPRFEIGLSAGGLLGGIRREVSIQDDSILAGGAHASSADKIDLGWGFEAALSAKYWLTPGLALIASYEALFLGNVVRADDASDFGQAGTGAVAARQKTSGLLTRSLFLGIQVDF